MNFPIIKTDFGITFTGAMGGDYPRDTIPNEIVAAFRTYSKELLELKVTDVEYKNGKDVSFICFEINVNSKELFSNREKIHEVFEKIAGVLKTSQHQMDAFTSHSTPGGYTVGMFGQLRMPANQ